MSWQVVVLALIIVGAFFLIARKGGCCVPRGTEKKDSEEKPQSK